MPAWHVWLRYDNGRNDMAMRCGTENAHDYAKCQTDCCFDGKRRQIAAERTQMDLSKTPSPFVEYNFYSFNSMRQERCPTYESVDLRQIERQKIITTPKFSHSQREAMHLAINFVRDSMSATSRYVHSKIRWQLLAMNLAMVFHWQLWYRRQGKLCFLRQPNAMQRKIPDRMVPYYLPNAMDSMYSVRLNWNCRDSRNHFQL